MSLPPPQRIRKNRARWILLLILIGLLAVWGVSHFMGRPKGGADSAETADAGKGKGKGSKAVPVSVIRVRQQDMPIVLEALGHVEAVAAVNIRPQVSSVLQQVLFKEGDRVIKGQPLFQLDAQPYQQALNQALAQVQKDEALINQAQAVVQSDQAQVRSAMATVTRDKAQLALARVQEGRYVGLLAKDFVSRDQVDQSRTTRLAAQATVQNDQAEVARYQAQVQSDQAGVANARAVKQADNAAVQTARINLAYCTLKAPMTGKTGSLSAHVGDVVTANTTALVNITQLAPVYVTFSVPEQSLQQIQVAKQKGIARVFAILPQNAHIPSADNAAQASEVGTLSFLDNTVDPTTGTLKLRGTFSNVHKALWAGQFVNLRLVLGDQPDALVLPVTAVLSGQKGSYVFVPENKKAVYRTVVTGATVNDQVIITSGLKAGDEVIGDGQAQLAPNMPIRVKPGL